MPTTYQTTATVTLRSERTGELLEFAVRLRRPRCLTEAQAERTIRRNWRALGLSRPSQLVAVTRVEYAGLAS